MSKVFKIKGLEYLLATVFMTVPMAGAAEEPEVIAESYVVVQDETGNVIFEGSGGDDIGEALEIVPGLKGDPISGKNGSNAEFQKQLAEEMSGFMAKMHKQQLERIKKELAVTDEEWAVIKPRVEKVMDLSWHGFAMPPAQSEEKADNPEAAVHKAISELDKATKKESPSTVEIKAKLAALRGAKEKQKQQVSAAQQKLKEVLTIRQEAILVINGLLE